ncbi:hypothetical protein ACA910_010592 [Epithemia clementina (nom. ined.)]
MTDADISFDDSTTNNNSSTNNNDRNIDDVLAAVAATSNHHVYIRSNEYGWIPARVLEMQDNGQKAKVSVPIYRNEAAIQSDGGKKAKSFETRVVDLREYPNQTLLLQNVNEEGHLKQVEDMVDLPFLHEAAILFNLKARHIQGKPYTRTGDIVIACNPYQWIHNLYSTSTRRHYANALVWNSASSALTKASLKNLEPHIYEVSAAAYRGLAIDGMNQSILVSGESGAGKTESVKICLHHIACVQEGTAGQEDISNEEDESTAFNSTTTPSKTTTPTPTTTTSAIVQRVLDSNPLLEAFGNAQTIRNDNSSRFGKFIQLQFDCEDPVDAVFAGHRLPSCVLAGSKCEVYLLEKSRVVQHEPEERTYHIFYQLLASDNEIKKEIWAKGLVDTDQESFSYVGYAELDTIEGLTDQQRFQKTLESLALVGVTGEKKLTLFRAICIVLQLGNLLVEPDPEDEDNRAIISSREELEDLADLMGVEASLLESSFLIRTMRARNEEFKVPLSAQQAQDSCDAFAKEIYASAFTWLVHRINEATSAEQNYHPLSKSNHGRSKRGPSGGGAAAATGAPQSFGLIGLLDIFGFESFGTNRFEQLCINYANEKLQQKFTQDIFRSVQSEYESEGIELGEIRYDDNTDVLDLVEGRVNGLLALLNEECVRPGGNDKAFVVKVVDHHTRQPKSCLFRGKRFGEYEFGVKHYAGEVVYNAEGFVNKNMDTLPTDLQECAKKSSNDILAQHMIVMGAEDENAADGGAVAAAAAAAATSSNEDKKSNAKRPPKKKPPTSRRQQQQQQEKAEQEAVKEKEKKGSTLVGQTVWTKFKGQLSSLMQNLGRTRTRYIRCIKPNTKKQPLVMEHLPTVEQLRCAGVVAAVTISRSAFPNRLEHGVVQERFKALWESKAHQKQAHELTLEQLGDDSNDDDGCEGSSNRSPDKYNKLMAERLLTAAMKDLETTATTTTKTKNPDDGSIVEETKTVVVRAFVMGHTRTYFRAGALEFLEAERLKRLGIWAANIQRIIRGFCAWSVYRRLRRTVIVLQSLQRQRLATRAYHCFRRAAICLECWRRCIVSKGRLITLRRNYRATRIQTKWRCLVVRTLYHTKRKSSIMVQAMIRGALQRPKYRKALHQAKEDAKLENQVLALQRKLEEAEARRVEAERMAEEKARKAVEAYNKEQEEKKEMEQQQREKEEKERKEKEERELEEQQQQKEEKEEAPKEEKEKATEDQDDEVASAAASGAARAAAAQPDTPSSSQQQLTLQQQALIDESGRMLDFLRKEVFRLRGQNAQLRRDMDLLKDNNQRLMDANASAGATFASLNHHAKQLTKANEKLSGEIVQLRQQYQNAVVVQTELREELKMKHATYVAEVHSRIQYQKALNVVVEKVERKCRDTRLVEEILMIADDCETGGGAENPNDDAATAATSSSSKTVASTNGTQPPSSSLMSSFRSLWS